MGASTRLLSSALLLLTWLPGAGCPDQAETCRSDNDCPGEQLCIEQICRHTCNATAECATGERCLQGYCAPASDASVGDATLHDAASSDAATGDAEGGDRGASDHQGFDRAASDVTMVDTLRPDAAGSDGRISDGASDDRAVDCAHGLICAEPHTRCDDSDGTPDCDCAIGYSQQAGGCAWTGGPLDPGFQQDSAWTVSGSATVDLVAAGADDPGIGLFLPAAACETGGTIEQTFEMPALADAEQLVLRFKVRAISGYDPYCHSALVRVIVAGGVYEYYVYGSTWQDETICLGARAYGAPLALVFEVPQQCMMCHIPDDGPAFEIDDVDLEVAADGECPAFGSVVNGDFEAGSWGWTATTNAAVLTGVGTGGSLGGQMTLAQVCDFAALTGQVSLPLPGPSPTLALQYRSQGTAGMPMPITIGTLALASDVGSGAFETRRVCLLDGLKGLYFDLTFSLNGIGGLCSDPYGRTFAIDDVALVDEPDCPAAVHIFDPGFENVVDAPQLYPTWRYQASYGATAAPYENAPAAHTGNISARLLVNAICGAASASTVITVPPAAGQSGPAVAFWYRLPSATSSRLWVGEEVPVAASYARFVHCLDSTLIGRATALSITLSNSQTGVCGTSATTETAWIDDVEVTTDSSCAP